MKIFFLLGVSRPLLRNGCAELKEEYTESCWIGGASGESEFEIFDIIQYVYK